MIGAARLVVVMPRAASGLLALQIGARLGTFVLNQVLVRTASPAVFGAANVQLELVLSTVLALSREGTRALMLRRQDALRRGDPMLHNLALVPVWIGSVLSVVVGWAYVTYLAPAALWAQSGVAVPVSVALYGLGAWLELWAEPLHTCALGLDAYVSIRVAMEAGGLAAKAVVTAVLLQPACLAAMQRCVAAYVALSSEACALLAFAWGRVAYGAMVLLVGAVCLRGHARRWWWPTSAAAVWGDAPTRAFLRVTTGQAALKPVKPQRRKGLLHRVPAAAPAGKVRGQRGIFAGVERFQQVIVLEYEGALRAARRVDRAGAVLGFRAERRDAERATHRPGEGDERARGAQVRAGHLVLHGDDEVLHHHPRPCADDEHRGRDEPVGRVPPDPGHQEQPHREGRGTGDEPDLPAAGAGHGPARDGRGDEETEDEGGRHDPRHHRAVAAGELEVLPEEDRAREEPDADEEARERGQHDRAVLEQAQGDDRLARAGLDEDRQRQQGDPARHHRDLCRRRPDHRRAGRVAGGGAGRPVGRGRR